MFNIFNLNLFIYLYLLIEIFILIYSYKIQRLMWTFNISPQLKDHLTGVYDAAKVRIDSRPFMDMKIGAC